ncbi:MAG: bactofilin family protein [Mycobacterium leprae]
MAGSRIDVMISRGGKVEGQELHFTGTLRVEGTLQAQVVHADELVVGVDGRVEGRVVCDSLEVAGCVSSDPLVCRQLSILSSGRVDGDVHCGQLTIEEGGVLAGNSHMPTEP